MAYVVPILSHLLIVIIQLTIVRLISPGTIGYYAETRLLQISDLAQRVCSRLVG